MFRTVPLFALALAVLATRLPAQAPVPDKPDPARFRLLVEPRFQSPPVWELLPRAKETGIAAGTLDARGQPKFLTPADLALARTDFAEFRRKAQEPIDALFAASTPTLLKDKDGRPSHAIYHSKDPLTGTLILAAKLLDRHRADFGGVLFAVIPDRYTLVLFRADQALLEAQTPMLAEINDQSIYPVSLEVFQINAAGIMVIGNLSGE